MGDTWHQGIEHGTGPRHIHPGHRVHQRNHTRGSDQALTSGGASAHNSLLRPNNQYQALVYWFITRYLQFRYLRHQHLQQHHQPKRTLLRIRRRTVVVSFYARPEKFELTVSQKGTSSKSAPISTSDSCTSQNTHRYQSRQHSNRPTHRHDYFIV